MKVTVQCVDLNRETVEQDHKEVLKLLIGCHNVRRTSFSLKKVRTTGEFTTLCVLHVRKHYKNRSNVCVSASRVIMFKNTGA